MSSGKVVDLALLCDQAVASSENVRVLKVLRFSSISSARDASPNRSWPGSPRGRSRTGSSRPAIPSTERSRRSNPVTLSTEQIHPSGVLGRARTAASTASGLRVHPGDLVQPTLPVRLVRDRETQVVPARLARHDQMADAQMILAVFHRPADRGRAVVQSRPIRVPARPCRRCRWLGGRTCRYSQRPAAANR